ncbi:hypothetical protein RJ45_08775 [Photobacterium gaetbulicola]|uniref:Carrier domain-containing protein n=1 Tax=Photobacterium gaetbulicola TaxID=1295392 RepID=A0A0B9H521_9GAMM|nr:non-ribosomal peptide synthetase [Photobacterium gaetbulicola]KHT63997.1 hypothetical protein RJ45_08775 [Photobacterium gaetbulicola]
MNLTELIALCRSKGIIIRLVDGNLKIAGQADQLDPATLSLLKAHKADLIAYLDQARESDRAAYSVVATQNKGAYSRSLNQSAMYFLHQFDKEQAAGNLPSIYRIEGEVDRAALAVAFNQLIERHEVLRTAYGEDIDHTRLLAHSPFELQYDDLRNSTAGEAELNAKLDGLARSEAGYHFDLEHGEVIRARLVRTQADQYLLLLTLHHIAADGWSWQIITDELSELYRCAKANQPAPLPVLERQYRDFALSQRQWLDQRGAEPLLAYWRQKMAGAPALHGVPTDFARPAELLYHGRSLVSDISAAQRQQLEAMQRDTGATLFVLLQSLLSVLVARYSGEREHVIGTPVHGRHQAELESVCGYFVNMLPLRVETADGISFRGLVEQNTQTVNDMLEHQLAPFELIVNALEPERSTSHNPLFQIVFSLHNKIEDLQLAGASVERKLPRDMPARFDLNLHAVDDGHQIRLLWEYNTALFSEETIGQLSAHYLRLLDAALASPQADIETLPMLSTPELASLPGLSREAFPVSRCLHQAVQSFADTTPEATAISIDGQHYSYRYLNRKADALAATLLEAGVGRNRIVGLCVERSVEMLIGIVAILKAGGAYLPLDPAYPKERLDYVLGDAQPVAVIKQSGLEVDLSAYSGVVTELEAGRLADDAAPVAVASLPDDLAYIIYTSGSTGRPKGVMVSHANVMRLFSSSERHFRFGADDVWTLFHSFAFDFSVWEIWGAFLYGGRLVVVNQEISRAPERFAQLLASEGVTVLNQTPSAFYPLSQHLIANQAPLSLRYVVFGGEALELPKLKPWFGHFGDSCPEMVNMYGITETTVHVTYCRLDADMVSSNASIIGVPLSDLQLYVCNPKMHCQPCGVGGEMYVGGAGVTLGYLERPDLNAARFIDNPFGPGKLYRTGDLARWLPDGQLEYLGRIDHQVKIRGFRIELGEIESRLNRHPDVAQATVLVSEVDGHKQLLAWVQAESGVADVAALRHYLAEFLPAHMVPHHLIAVQAMPLTVNGKVDRNRLLAMERTAVNREYVSPSTENERRLAEIWQQVLGVAKVGITESFFAIGGDSMLALKVTALAKEQGLSLDVSTLFRKQTIQAVAADFEAQTDSPITQAELSVPFSLLPEPTATRLKRRWGEAITDAYPASSLQEGMLFHSLSGDNSQSYHDLLSYRAEADWDPAHFEAALTEVANRHEILRTQFDISSDRICQLVCAKAAIEWHCLDWRQMDSVDHEQAFADWLCQERQRPFNIEALPLFRVFVHRLSDQRFIYTLSVLHAVLDGWSVSSFNTELFGRYHAAVYGYPYGDDHTPLPYRAFIEQELSVRESETVASTWGQRLDSATVTALDLPLPAKASSARVKRQYPEFARLSEQLLGLAARLGVPMQHLLVAGHLKVLSLLTGSSDVLSCLVTNCRPEQLGSELSLGLFLNAMPIRQQLESDSWSGMIRALSHTLNEWMAERHYPLQDIQQQTGLTLDKILFNYIHFHSYEQLEGLDGFKLEPFEMVDQSNFELSVQFVHLPGDQLVLELQVPGEAENLAYLAELAGYYQRVFEQMVAAPDASHSSSALLPAAERTKLLEHADAKRGSAEPKTVAGHFAAQCQRTPQATALISNDSKLTYQELDQASVRLASWLVSQGFGAHSRIGINMSRTPEMVKAVLAVLKLGATYVPLDPAYPAERLTMAADDAGLAVILAERPQAWHAGSAEAVVPFGPQGNIELDVCQPAELALAADPNRTSYIIYTSGSTGRPKGVLGSEQGIINRLDWMWQRYPFDAGEVGCFKTSINFVDHVWELFGCLLKGIPLVLLDQEDVVDTRRLVEKLSRFEVSRIVLVPTLLQAILAQPAANLVGLGALKWWTSSGERLPEALVQAFYRRFPQAVLLNLYGSSEVAADVSCFDTRQPVAGETRGASCIGSAICGAQLYVLNDDLQLLPEGVPGELYVGGPGIANGYTDPAQTATRFVDNPFGQGRLFKTGDIVRWASDGNLLYIGRNDDQVKIRGHRIELGDIEHALLLAESVAQAATVVVSRNGERVIAAYLTASPGSHIDTAVLGEQLMERLPSAMIPAAFMVLDSLPLLPNGKIDRRQLPQPQFASASRYLPPRNALERDLCAIWQHQLQVEKVGIQDSFFALGGNSITALKLAAEMESVIGRPVPLSALFTHKSIAALSEYFASEGDSQPATIQIAVEKTESQNNRMKL